MGLVQDRPDYLHCAQLAQQLADLLAPQSGAYYDVWLDGEKFASATMEVCSFRLASCSCALLLLVCMYVISRPGVGLQVPVHADIGLSRCRAASVCTVPPGVLPCSSTAWLSA